MAATRRAPVLLGLAAATIAIVLALHGIAGRDLSGDEQNMLHGSPAQILEWSLDPRGGFVGHLPFSFWARWAFLTLFSEVPAWAWRLHAVLFTGLAVGLTTATAHRHFGMRVGLLAGLILAADPIVDFHAREASNYAASVLAGALVLRGVLDLSADKRTGAPWLAGGLLLGAANDFYIALIGLPALGICLGLARRRPLRRAMALAWAAPILAVTPFAVIFVLRLLESTGTAVLDVHADPLPPRPLPALLDAPWRLARRMFGAHLDGYAGGRNDAPWIGLPPVVFAVILLLGRLRSRAWPAAGLLFGGLLLHSLMSLALQLGVARILPYEPRTLIGLSPALALAVATVAGGSRASSIGRTAARIAVPMVWLLSASLASLEAHLSPGDLRERAIDHARTVAPEARLVIPEARTRTRAPDAVPCAPADTDAAVVIMNHEVTQLPMCQGTSSLRLTHRHFFDAPVYEGSAASFLPRRVVAVFGRAVDPAPLRIERTVADGLDGVTWSHTQRDGTTLSHGTEQPAWPTAEDWTLLSAAPIAPTWLPDHPLLQSHRNQVQATELDPLDRRPTLRAAPLRSPWWTTLRRCLPLLGVFLVLLTMRRST